jgi:hypothetical protein
MPLTLEQIVEETRHWNHARLAELVDNLTLELHGGIPPDVDDAWKKEARRRLAEIESGSPPIWPAGRKLPPRCTR